MPSRNAASSRTPEADGVVKRLRQRMAGWGGPSGALGAEAASYDGRFREAVADDLNMPRAVVILNELVSSDVPDGDKHALLSSWDRVLGLDLEREVREAWTPTDEMEKLVTQRDAARAAKDFAKADELRDRLQAMGLEVMDTPEGTKVRLRR